MSRPERRRFPRYKIRLSIQFLRGEAEVAGEIFNISRCGCLLVTPVAMQPEERVVAALPLLGQPSMTFRVVRTRPLGVWWAVSADFEPMLPNDDLLVKLASEEGAAEDPDQLF